MLHEYCVHMIRHDNKGDHEGSLTIEVPQRLCHDFGTVVSPQNECAMASIELAFDCAGEAFVIFALDFAAPRLRMDAQPRLAFRFPLSAQVMRHGIS